MEDTQDEQSGFTLAEVVVAITLAGILLAVLAPLIIGTVMATAKMTSIASATQVAAAGNDVARAGIENGTCAALLAAGPATSSSTDQRGVTMQRTVTVTGPCTSKKTATVTVEVTASSTTTLFTAGQTLASTSTRVYVP
jgi:prepilin-type N-terminal cleavage/methylation domain-containing protein